MIAMKTPRLAKVCKTRKFVPLNNSKVPFNKNKHISISQAGAVVGIARFDLS